MVSGAFLVESWVTEYIGLPFKVKGRDAKGVDCYGLVRLVLSERYGKALPSFSDGYTDMEDRALLACLVDAHKPMINAERVVEPIPGDVVVIKYCGYPCHLGLYVGGGMMLHVEAGKNAALDRLDSYRMKNRIEGYYRVN